MDYGYVIKSTNDFYIVNVDLNNYYSGYSVVPKMEDPHNAYEIENIRTYCKANPDKVLTEHPKKLEEQNKAEVERLKQYLRDTDYAVIKCSEQGLNIETEYPNLKTKRQNARYRINELEELSS